MNILFFLKKSSTLSCIIFQLLAHKQKKTAFYGLTFFQVVETYSIMIILLSLSQQKKSLTVYEGLVRYLLIYSKEQVTNQAKKQRHSYCFPKKIFSVHSLKTDLHFARFAAALTLFLDCHLHCHAVIVVLSSSCASLPVHQMAAVTNPPSPHTVSPHILRHKGSGKWATCLEMLLS